jgi:hypothetical protein
MALSLPPLQQKSMGSVGFITSKFSYCLDLAEMERSMLRPYPGV